MRYYQLTQDAFIDGHLMKSGSVIERPDDYHPINAIHLKEVEKPAVHPSLHATIEERLALIEQRLGIPTHAVAKPAGQVNPPAVNPPAGQAHAPLPGKPDPAGKPSR